MGGNWGRETTAMGWSSVEMVLLMNQGHRPGEVINKGSLPTLWRGCFFDGGILQSKGSMAHWIHDTGA